ncbi:hypothetical protein PR003_g24950 [Phytophthora rubi]|uniref:Secreted protein n=1 Tax=Phytophthora rubi TaxID=129364 RepID=A0A6A4CIF2_9STRA|nr:hypothetical protein PR003_g24950 [Phytophthora rubi]
MLCNGALPWFPWLFTASGCGILMSMIRNRMGAGSPECIRDDPHLCALPSPYRFPIIACSASCTAAAGIVHRNDCR